MKTTVILLSLLFQAGCATTRAPSADSAAQATALLGETKLQRSIANYDRYTLAGVDQRWRWVRPSFEEHGDRRFVRVPAGKHTVHVRLLATANRGLPGLRDEFIVFDQVELDAGKSYVINGERSGEEFDVWIEDVATREHVTSAIRLKPRRQNSPF